MSCNPFQLESPGFAKLLVVGAGGSGREVAWLSEQIWGSRICVEFVVDQAKYLSGSVNGLPIRLLNDVVPDPTSRFLVAIGDPVQRRRIAMLCHAIDLQATKLVHPRAEISRFAEIGEGSLISAGVVVSTNIRLGCHVHVNVSCSISHDVVIDDYATLSPGVHVSGHVHVGEGVFIGTGANIINGSAATPLRIGKGAIIAAGACITGSVEPGALMAGVPGIRKR